MNITLLPSKIGGSVRVPTSKSEAHRLLIAAALSALYSDMTVIKTHYIECTDTNEDIDATVRCLCGIGAKICRADNGFYVTPITPESLKGVESGVVIDCGESGSTLRFILPIIPALRLNVKIRMHGRLPARPLSPLDGELMAHGAIISLEGEDLLCVHGNLDRGDSFSIRGDISSQFVSGLLFALPLLPKNCTLTVAGKIESAPYIHMTLDALSKFTDKVRGELPKLTIAKCGSSSDCALNASGDWSGAAFWLAAGVVGNRPIRLTGLSLDTHQGDFAVIDVLRSFGAGIEIADGVIIAYPSRLIGTSVDASQIPDLVPIIATVASVAEGETHIFGAQRLKLKESDRLESVSRMLSDLGADVRMLDDGLILHGVSRLCGGCVDSFSDHRIAMSACVASTLCTAPVTVLGAECVAKSYPAFWQDYKALGGVIENE